MKQTNTMEGKHLGDMAWCECDCHTKGTPQPSCDKCYTTNPIKQKIEGGKKITNLLNNKNK